MQQNSNDAAQFPAHYNHPLLNWQKTQLGLTTRGIARALGISERTAFQVFKGRAVAKSVYPVVELLGLDWSLVHDLDLPEPHFHRAVRKRKHQGSHPIAPIE